PVRAGHGHDGRAGPVHRPGHGRCAREVLGHRRAHRGRRRHHGQGSRGDDGRRARDRCRDRTAAGGTLMGDAASPAPRYDVVVVGGGLVGGSVAVGLARTGLRVALVETAPPVPGTATWDERCIAINQASYRILRELGVWAELSRLAAPITSTHISEQGRFGVARFTAADAGLDALGYNVPIRRIGEVLWSAAARQPDRKST